MNPEEIEMKPERVIIAGGREFNDYRLMCETMCNHPMVRQVVSGKARGADSLGERWAKEHGVPVVCMPAQWDRYGKSAGYRRNEEMAAKADKVIAFWDGESRGTKHMIDIAAKRGLEVVVVRY